MALHMGCGLCESGLTRTECCDCGIPVCDQCRDSWHRCYECVRKLEDAAEQAEREAEAEDWE